MRGLSNRLHPASSLIRGEAVDNDNATQGTNPGPVGRSSSIVSRKRPKQNQVRLSDDEVDVVIAGYEAGLDLNELSSAFDADRRTLASRLEQRGIPRRSRRLTDEQIQEAIALYADGWSLARIANQFGVYPQSIRYRLQRAGVILRPRLGWSPEEP